MVMAGSTGREVDIAGYGWDGGGGGYSVWLKWPYIAICVTCEYQSIALHRRSFAEATCL